MTYLSERTVSARPMSILLLNVDRMPGPKSKMATSSVDVFITDAHKYTQVISINAVAIKMLLRPEHAAGRALRSSYNPSTSSSVDIRILIATPIASLIKTSLTDDLLIDLSVI